MKKQKIQKSEFKTKSDFKGRMLMICQNSVPTGKYFKGIICNSWTVVNSDTASVLCSQCVAQIADPPIQRASIIKSDKPKGWKFMKQFVAKDGTVYFKGIEQQNLKGKLTPTVIEPKEPKKKISKQEKDELIRSLGKEITTLKSKLMFETKKGKRAEYARLLSRANRTLKKLI